MSREIKFRCYDNTVSDYISFEDMPVIPMNESDLLLELENDVDITFEQYTGLKDKNGVKIYENDIIEIDDHNVLNEEINEFVQIKSTILFENGGFYTVDECDITNIGFHINENPYYNNIKVIGNIHQNKDLLC